MIVYSLKNFFIPTISSVHVNMHSLFILLSDFAGKVNDFKLINQEKSGIIHGFI